MPASDVPAWAKASTKPTYTKAEVGLGNVDNTADKDKSVKHATSAGSAGTASSVDWSGVKNPPTTYAPSAHTHGSGDITSLSADKITGVIGIDHLPAGALERCKIVTDDAARFKLTTSDVQNGDTVKVGTDANAKMYLVIDDTKLSSEAGYTIYTAGSATSVPWSGVTGKPSTFAPSAHTHDDRYYTESEINSKLNGKSNTGHTHAYAGSSSAGGAANSAVKLDTATAGSATHPVYFTGGKPVACTYTINASVPSGAKFTDTNTWRPLGTTGDTACAGNDSRLSNARPASDVYSWAKASSKPSYSWGEISGKPSTFTPSSHTHNYAGSSSAGGSANWANGASYANYANKIACNPTEDKSTNGLFMFQYNENTTICPDSAWWSVVRTQHPGYNNGYWQEMAYNFDSDIIKFRRNVNGSKSAWKTIAFTDSKVSSAGYADSAGSATTATNATNANYLNIVANNEIRFNKPSWTTKNDLWIGYKWADSPAADLINTYHFANGNGGYASIAAASVNVTNVNATEYVKIGQPNTSNNSAIEMYGNTPYIDFHAGGTNTDYTSRIIAYNDRIEFVFA